MTQEVIKRQKYSVAVDVWNLGVVLFYLTTGHLYQTILFLEYLCLMNVFNKASDSRLCSVVLELLATSIFTVHLYTCTALALTGFTGKYHTIPTHSRILFTMENIIYY